MLLYYVVNPNSDYFHTCILNLQARLNEIITSGAKTVHNNGSPPWMADGAGLPSNAFELLPKLVITFFKNNTYDAYMKEATSAISTCFEICHKKL